MRWNELVEDIALPDVVFHGTTAEQWSKETGLRMDWSEGNEVDGLHVARSPILPEDYAYWRAKKHGETPILVTFRLDDLLAAGLEFAPNENLLRNGECQGWEDCLTQHGVMIVKGFGDQHKAIGTVQVLKRRK